MAITPILLDDDGWKQLTTLLENRQSNKIIVPNLVRHFEELGAVTVLVEDEYLDRDFTEAYASYYATLFKRHSKICSRVHLFSTDLSEILASESASNLARKLEQEGQSSYLGFVVLRPIHEAPLAQAVLKTPDPPSEYECHPLVKAEFSVHVLGAELKIDAMPMTQQDQRIGACAQASIWSASRHFHVRHRGPWVSMVGITEAALSHESASVSSTIPNGSEFLSLNGMVSSLRASGRKPLTYLGEGASTPFKWQGIRPKDVINRYLDSGIPVIVGLFDPKWGGGHAVVATGQVFNSSSLDKSKLPIRPTRAEFCSAYYVNDDQRGPNLRMAVDTGGSIGETDYSVEENIYFLIVPLPDKVFVPAEKAELFAWGLLETYQASWKNICRDFSNILKSSVELGNEFSAEIQSNDVIARTYLTYGWKYKHRLIRNNLTPETQAFARSTELPRYVWVTEFGTVDSLSHVDKKERRIFAHCVVDATAKNMGEDCRLFFHGPGLAIRRFHDPQNPSGDYKEENLIIPDDQAYYPKLRGTVDFQEYGE